MVVCDRNSKWGAYSNETVSVSIGATSSVKNGHIRVETGAGIPAR